MMANNAVSAKAFEVHPPHLRYQAQTKVMLTIQAANRVTAPQEIFSGNGFGGRSGLKQTRTSGIANSARGTLIQKIHRQEAASFTSATSSGVVGRVAYATTP